jgi:hypothetical protein
VLRVPLIEVAELKLKRLRMGLGDHERGACVAEIAEAKLLEASASDRWPKAAGATSGVPNSRHWIRASSATMQAKPTSSNAPPRTMSHMQPIAATVGTVAGAPGRPSEPAPVAA